MGKKYSQLTGATRFIIVLAGILFVSNILLNIAMKNDESKAIEAVNSNVFSEENSEIYEMVGLGDLFYGMKQAFQSAIQIIFTYIGCVISFWIGKLLGAFKSIAELLADIASDGIGFYALLIYDVIGMFLDIQSIASLITAMP